MNKHVKISLIVLVTFVLLLAIAIPALAGPQGTKCRLSWRFHNDILDEDFFVEVDGIGVLKLTGHKLTKTCTGNIPLGESFGYVTYYTLDDMRDYLCEEWGDPDDPDPYPACNISTPFTVGPDETGDRYSYITYKNILLSTLDWELVVQDNGDYEWVSVFTLE